MNNTRKKPSIIYLVRDKMWVKTPDKVITAKWTHETLSSVLAAIKDQHGITHAKIILGEELCYLLMLESEKKDLSDHNVQTTLERLIPDEISHNNFAWKEIKAKGQSGTTHVQALVVPSWLILLFIEAARKSGVSIERFVAASSLIGYSTDRDKHASLTLWGGYENLAVIARGGVVYASRVLSGDSGDDIRKLLTFVEEDLDFELGKAVIAGTLDNEPSLSPQWKTERKEIDVMAALTKSENKRSFKTKVVELDMPEKPEKDEEPTIEPLVPEEEPVLEPDTLSAAKHFSDEVEDTDGEGKIRKFDKKILALLIILPIVSAIVAGSLVYFAVGRTPAPEPVQEEQVVVEATPEPTPTPEPVDLSDYTAQVLNGSGVTGAASDAAALLEDGGFVDVDTGNASSSSVITTKISTKKDAPDGLYDQTVELLSDYKVKKGAVLDEDSDYDIVVTLGTK